MATVLPFSSGGPKPPKAQVPRGPASIIIFPGVRYERQMAGEPVKPAASGQDARKHN